MNRKTIVTMSASAVSAVVIGVFGGMSVSSATADTATPGPAPRSGAHLPKAAASLTDQEKRDLAFSREEERMARDLYQLLANKYDQARPFSMITRSEQQHFTMAGMLLQRYGLADPSAGKPAGKYANADIQKLYDGWVAQGSKSLAEAYKVGVALETEDIADLKAMLSRTKAADVKQVYTNLLRASQNHQRAYTGASKGQMPGMGMGRGPGQGPGAQQGRMGQGQQRGPGMGRMGQGPGGYGRTGERPADCPMIST